MRTRSKNPQAEIQGAVEDITRRAIRDLEDLARCRYDLPAIDIQRTVELLRSSLPS